MPATQGKEYYGQPMNCFHTLRGTASPQTYTTQSLQGKQGVFIKPDDYTLGQGVRDVNKLLLCENFT